MKLSKKNIFTLLCATCFIVACFYYRVIGVTWLEKIISVVTYPALLVQRAVIHPLKMRNTRQHTLAELETLLTSYKQQSQDLLAEIIALQAQHSFCEATHELHAFAQRYKQPPVCTAHILLRHSSDTEHFFLIDAGAQRGIAPDMVVVYKNCVLGRVEKVYPYYAKVTSITDASMKIPVYCATTKAQGIFQGTQQLATAQLAYISHLQKIAENDLVITQGEGLIYPAGFAVGRIKECQLDALGITYEITLDLLYKLEDIEYCAVIQKGAECESGHE